MVVVEKNLMKRRVDYVVDGPRQVIDWKGQ